MKSHHFWKESGIENLSIVSSKKSGAILTNVLLFASPTNIITKMVNGSAHMVNCQKHVDRTAAFHVIHIVLVPVAA